MVVPFAPQPPQPVYYSYCRTPIGDSPVIQGGLAPNSSCWMPNFYGQPVWGYVIGFYR